MTKRDDQRPLGGDNWPHIVVHLVEALISWLNYLLLVCDAATDTK